MNPITTPLFIGISSLFLATAVPAQDGENQPRRCVTLARVDRTEIINNQNIAFFLRGGDIYVNQLDRACRQLRPDRPFSYRTSSGQLCRSDLITVLQDFGNGLVSGASCSLGMFSPTTEDALAMLKLESSDGGLAGQPEVTVTEVEVDAEVDAADDEAAQ